jgi:D-alanine transaminase
MSIVYLNGEYLPLEEARVSVLDRGFTFGDGVYEVIPVYNYCLFRWREHLQRLDNSLRAIGLENPLSHEEWLAVLRELVARQPSHDQSVYLQVTRGVSPRDHAFPDEMRPTVFAMSRPLPRQDYSTGVAAITRPDIRWQWCHIKAITLLPSVLLRQEAARAGAKEVILLRDGRVTEGAASNVFIVAGGVVLTPPKDNYVLPGITRDLVLELLRADRIECAETTVTETQLRQADEIWITSSTQEVVPVVRLDGVAVGSGTPGELWRRAHRLYQEFKIAVGCGTAPDAVIAGGA